MSKKKKIAIVIGTRPEVIKTASIIREILAFPKEFQLSLIASAQHRKMLDQMLAVFKIKPDYDFNIMTLNQSLFHISAEVLKNLEALWRSNKPDLVVMQGDTTTGFFAALSAFYYQIPIAHIESGYRSYQKYDPFPEEINRVLIDNIADICFVTTKLCRQNLLNEGMNKNKIWVTGSTAVDSAAFISRQKYEAKNDVIRRLNFSKNKIIFLTCHRRESWGKKMEDIFKGVRKIANENDDVEVVFPVHLNSQVQTVASKVFASTKNIHLVEPLDYKDAIFLLKNCYFVATDSGGIVEEAAYFKKPLLVLRLLTEKLEAVKAGNAKVTGIEPENIYKDLKRLLEDKKEYKRMSLSKNPYGKGVAYKVIIDTIRNYFKVKE